MASHSESAESVGGLGHKDGVQMTRPPLVEECILSEEPAERFGEHFLKTNLPKEGEDIVMTGSCPVVEAESDEDGVDLAVEQSVIRGAMKVLRDRRHDGYYDKLRVQRRIGMRKAQPIRQGMKKDKHHAEGKLEENGRGGYKERSRSSKSSRAPQPVQEYITPSCVRGSYRVPLVVQGRAPPSPTLVGTGFTATTQTLLAQLKEIELHPPMVLTEDDEAMLSPITSPAMPLKGEGELRKPWNGEVIHGQYMQAMDHSRTTEKQTQLPQASPYEMRDQGCSLMCESPSP
ncbi:hypothetical protein EV426DRAFT_410671 [Tirmania nivea]|nr:hypothetical protein EV426DRAFT_410671 [Tirmania nivea]